MTPLMRQYWDIKALHQDKVLLFRMGDFFEMFFDDAVTAAPILGIALTQRNKKSNDETPMCGVPHHSIAGPINKLLSLGHKVAICDQIEDPKTAKGIVKRAVTRVLTPGMVYDPETLDQSSASYMASFAKAGSGYELSCIDTSTGESFCFKDIKEADLYRLLSILPIAELVIANKLEGVSLFQTEFHATTEVEGPESYQRLIAYLESLGSKDISGNLKPLVFKNLTQRLEMNASTIRHLELFNTYKGEGAGSLFHAVDRTKTSAGARLLKSWMNFPLTSRAEILDRQQRISVWMQDPPRLKQLREILGRLGDLERRLFKLTLPQCNARDLTALCEAGLAGIEVLKFAGQALPDLGFKDFFEYNNLVLRSIVDEPPLSVKQGYFIKSGVSPVLDELIELSTNSQKLLFELEAREKEATGISSLKIRYNNVFGYYIEITNTHKEKVPAHYLRKQTLANAERYCTEELIELEKKVLSANTRRSELEFSIFEEFRQKCLGFSNVYLNIAQLCSELDVISGLAWLAIERNYCRPSFTEGYLLLENSRHPVVEQTVKVPFVPNDIKLDSHGCLLLTGPNMAGKSTIMRQVALVALLAQMGSFVPAGKAELPIFDHLFTRIGASDQLSEGLSTFMVEMTETSEMLKRATSNSLLILDEIGRGTSTFDGLSLAQAILEHLVQEVRALTLFATHYHELTAMSDRFTSLKNAHMAVHEKTGEIRFLYSLRPGPALKSYGIQVAKLAGLPKSVTERAKFLLKGFEDKDSRSSSQLSLTECINQPEVDGQEAQDPELLRLKEDLKNFPVSQKTPLEAMMMIAQWQKTLSSMN